MAQLHKKYVIIKVGKKDQAVAQKAKEKKKEKKDASQGISNQRYYENGLSVKQAGINRELGKVNGLRYL